MWKKGPKEKEKVLRRLTEKEIQEQLYSFRIRENTPARIEPAKKEAVKEQQPVQPKEKIAVSVKNQYLILQAAISIIFLILIWFSVRQIIKIVSKVSVQQRTQGVVQLPAAKPLIKSKGVIKNK